MCVRMDFPPFWMDFPPLSRELHPDIEDLKQDIENCMIPLFVDGSPSILFVNSSMWREIHSNI